MDKQTAEKLLFSLYEIYENGPVLREDGICDNLPVQLYKDSSEWLKRSFRFWPKFSGSVLYPVPHPIIASPTVAYMDCEDFWDRSTQYGRDRWALLDYLIECAEEELKNG